MKIQMISMFFDYASIGGNLINLWKFWNADFIDT